MTKNPPVQSGEILLGVNTSIMNEKIWRKKIEFAKPKILTQRRSGVMHTAESNFFKLCDQIFWRNRNGIQKYLTLFIRFPDVFESWKKWRAKISRHTPYKISNKEKFMSPSTVPNFRYILYKKFTLLYCNPHNITNFFILYFLSSKKENSRSNKDLAECQDLKPWCCVV